jgi:hypothetical protein
MHFSKRLPTFAKTFLTASATAGGVLTALKVLDGRVEGQDEFVQYTSAQQSKHPISGMHKPFSTSQQAELEYFKKYFSQHAHLFPEVSELQDRLSSKTPVVIKTQSKLPVDLAGINTSVDVLAVGGPPALFSAAGLIMQNKSGKGVTYIYNSAGWPIANGSAWHIEEDAPSEAPTSYWPVVFVLNQFLRAIGYDRVPLESVKSTGLFPWRSLDWAAWLSHPSHWLTGIKIGFLFQLATMQDQAAQASLLQSVAKQCKANEAAFHQLNDILGGKLLLKGNGSIILARNSQELTELQALKEALASEGREFKMLSVSQVKARLGFAPKAVAYAEKSHDVILSPGYREALTGYIRDQGGNVIDAVLTALYINEGQAGGVAEYKTADGQSHFIRFAELYMSLGAHPVLNHRYKPLFDVVAARGISVLAHVYTPVDYQLPPALVCGGTNHVTKLSEPVVIEKDGLSFNLTLVRITAGACITPALNSKDAANYDGSAALGLVSAVRNALGEACVVHPLNVYGCNRQVSQYGQITWMQPYKGLHIQYGAGGGGLTRAFDAIVKPRENRDQEPRI